MPPDDPAVQVGAYITNGQNLYEIVGLTDSHVEVENCRTDSCFSVPRSSLRAYKLVRSTTALAFQI